MLRSDRMDIGLWLIVIVIIVIIIKYCAKEYNPPALEMLTYYKKAAKQVFGTLNEMGVEWWPSEGTLIGMLRWGDNFGEVDDGVLCSDTDIDIMVRVRNEKEWNEIKNKFSQKLLSDKMWKECIPHNHNIGISRKPKFTCYTYHKFGERLNSDDTNIHIDLHSYFVDEKNNIICMDPVCLENPEICRNKYPFQKWGGVAPYRGLIVDKNGKFGQSKFDDMVVPSPYHPIEILSLWNDGEYGDGNDLHLPKGNYCFKRKWIKNDYVLTANDRSKLRNISKNLYREGYASFSSYYPENSFNNTINF